MPGNLRPGSDFERGPPAKERRAKSASESGRVKRRMEEAEAWHRGLPGGVEPISSVGRLFLARRYPEIYPHWTHLRSSSRGDNFATFSSMERHALYRFEEAYGEHWREERNARDGPKDEDVRGRPIRLEDIRERERERTEWQRREDVNREREHERLEMLRMKSEDAPLGARADSSPRGPRTERARLGQDYNYRPDYKRNTYLSARDHWNQTPYYYRTRSPVMSRHRSASPPRYRQQSVEYSRRQPREYFRGDSYRPDPLRSPPERGFNVKGAASRLYPREKVAAQRSPTNDHGKPKAGPPQEKRDDPAANMRLAQIGQAKERAVQGKIPKATHPMPDFRSKIAMTERKVEDQAVPSAIDSPSRDSSTKDPCAPISPKSLSQSPSTAFFTAQSSPVIDQGGQAATELRPPLTSSEVTALEKAIIFPATSASLDNVSLSPPPIDSIAQTEYDPNSATMMAKANDRPRQDPRPSSSLPTHGGLVVDESHIGNSTYLSHETGGYGDPCGEADHQSFVLESRLKRPASVAQEDSPSKQKRVRFVDFPGTNNPLPAPGSIAIREVLRRTVDSAVENCRNWGNEHLGLAIVRLFDKSLHDTALEDLLNAVLSRNVTARQESDFCAHLKVARMEVIHAEEQHNPSMLTTDDRADSLLTSQIESRTSYPSIENAEGFVKGPLDAQRRHALQEAINGGLKVAHQENIYPGEAIMKLSEDSVHDDRLANLLEVMISGQASERQSAAFHTYFKIACQQTKKKQAGGLVKGPVPTLDTTRPESPSATSETFPASSKIGRRKTALAMWETEGALSPTKPHSKPHLDMNPVVEMDKGVEVRVVSIVAEITETREHTTDEAGHKKQKEGEGRNVQDRGLPDLAALDREGSNAKGGDLSSHATSQAAPSLLLDELWEHLNGSTAEA